MFVSPNPILDSDGDALCNLNDFLCTRINHTLKPEVHLLFGSFGSTVWAAYGIRDLLRLVIKSNVGKNKLARAGRAI